MQLTEYELNINQMPGPARTMDNLRQTGARIPDLVARLKAEGCTVITFDEKPFVNLIPTTILVGGKNHTKILEIGQELGFTYESSGRPYTLHNNGKPTAGQ